MATLFDDTERTGAICPVEARDIAAIRGMLAEPTLATGRKLSDAERRAFRQQIRAWIREARDQQ
jgi:uncharacterized membrane protein